MPQRTVTFDLGTDIGSLDELAVEEAWNNWTNALALEGLRPADVAYRSTERSATFRAFSKDLEEEAEHFTLDFDISKLMHRMISFAAYPVGIAALAAAVAQHASDIAGALQGLAS